LCRKRRGKNLKKKRSIQNELENKCLKPIQQRGLGKSLRGERKSPGDQGKNGTTKASALRWIGILHSGKKGEMRNAARDENKNGVQRGCASTRGNTAFIRGGKRRPQKRSVVLSKEPMGKKPRGNGGPPQPDKKTFGEKKCRS